MNDNYERLAIMITIVFGALTIGGLMAANIARNDHSGFLYALGAAGSGWLLAPAVLFNKPGFYRILLLLAIAFVIASIVAYVR